MLQYWMLVVRPLGVRYIMNSGIGSDHGPLSRMYFCVYGTHK